MAGSNKRKLSSSERKRLHRIILLVLFIAILFLLFAPGRSLMSYRSMQKQVAVMTSEIEHLEQRNQELTAEIKRLKTDDAYLEELARKKFGMLKENETVYEFSSGRDK